MADTIDIQLEGHSADIVSRCASPLSYVLHCKFGCMAHIEGVDVKRGAQQMRPVVPEERFAAFVGRGVKVSVWRNDLTNVKVDAVVNAANSYLRHIGGLALALYRAGGSYIQRESDYYVKEIGPVATGGAVVLSAGLLPCKHIIHAVGPCLPARPSQFEVSEAAMFLEMAIINILKRVEEYHMKTVAIPAISSGMFHFPLPLCANIVVSTVKEFCEKSRRHLPDEILLVNIEEPTVKEMERACRQLLNPPSPDSSAAAGVSSPPTVQLGNVRLTLKSGKIEEQQTDVIVNYISTVRNLAVGEVSSAILNRAGPGIQQEIYSASQQGRIVVTSSHSLMCKEVFHTFCSDTSKAAQQVLEALVLECLSMAISNKHRTISFPAISTGHLGFSKKDAALIMSYAVADFARKSSKELEVDFVVFPSDHNSYEAFAEAIMSLRQKASRPGFKREETAHFCDSKPLSPHIKLTGQSLESVREAKRWLSDILNVSSEVTIRNNFFQYIGEREIRQLSHLCRKGISIKESSKNGHTVINLIGEPRDVVVAALQVDAMLCNLQTVFVKEREWSMRRNSTENASFERKTVDPDSAEFQDRVMGFKEEKLHVLKVEKLENRALQINFDLKKKLLQCITPRKMWQRIPVQFCDMVSHIGFQAVCAPPADPAFGEGIYFCGTVKKAMEVWKEQDEQYVYFVEAEVLTGKSSHGKRDLTEPPFVDTNRQTRYDSVSGGSDIAVLFATDQALPRYIITCAADDDKSGSAMP